MDMLDTLLSQSSTPQVSPEMLETLGHKASLLFKQGIPLNQAIKQLTAEHPGLNNEHIKRVAEFANNVVFQEMFQNGQDKNVHFEVADPGVIIRDLKDGGSPAYDGKTMDYSGAPPKHQDAGMDQELMSMFNNGSTAGSSGGTTDMPKMASISWEDGHADPVNDVIDEQDRLRGTRDTMLGIYEKADLMFNDAEEDFYQQVKQQVLDPYGAGLGGVVRYLEKVANADQLEVVMTPVIQRLVEDGATSSQLNRSLEKQASGLPNMNHPLFIAWAGMLKTAHNRKMAELALTEVNDLLLETSAFLRKHAGVTSEVRDAVQGQKKVMPAFRQRFSK